MYKPLRNQKDPFPVEVSFKPILEDGELKMILLVLRDITKRKEVEKERYENEIRFKALSEATFEAVFLSIDGFGIDANEAAIKMFGYSREDISKMQSTDIIAPESKELVRKNMRSGYDKPYDGIAMRKDGSTFQAEFQGKLFEYKGKQVRVSSVRDITERKRNEELIRKSERELRISNKTKDKFFSIIAHDLKAPFSSMLGFSDLLKEGFYEMEVEEQKEIINLIHKGIKNTYELLDNLLFWASSQNGRIVFKPEKMNLFLLSNKEVNFLAQQANNKFITIENKINKTQIITGDKMMLSIIIRNLINNAIKFTPKGGKLMIGCSLNNTNEDSYIELYFKDNGVGIPEERQSKLFDISENTSTKGTEKEVGTGLGLMLCNEFVKSHNGEISFDSEMGKGTTFYVKIPV
jgi:PAS domain S-box-containing protein